MESIINKKLDHAAAILFGNATIIVQAYNAGAKLACWEYRQAGLSAAYDKLNAILPHDFRSNISLNKSMILNSKIKILLLEIL